MSDYLLLTDKQTCPACYCKGRVGHFRACPNCGTILFLNEINFASYERDGALRTYWLYTSDRGWMHRDQLMVRLEAQSRVVKIETPAPNNSTTPEQVRARGGKMTRRV